MPDPKPTFITALGLWDVVAMNIVAVVGLRWIARSARVGEPSVTLWVLAALAFFVPLAFAVSRLAERYPQQGGIYVWVRDACGPVHGFVCGWCVWVNNLFYFPSLLLFAAANLPLAFGVDGSALAENRLYSVSFVLIVMWGLIAINVIGFTRGKHVQNVGSYATFIPAALLIVFGAIAFVKFGSATSFAPAHLLPRSDILGTLSLWSAMCFGFSGFEITSLVGQEVKDAERTIPRGILIAGFVVLAIYIAGSASVLVALPASALAERSGISDAVDLVSGRLGLAGFGALTAFLITIGSIGGTSSWIAGAARVPFAAGVDHVLPRSFAKLHPVHRTPHVSLLVQGLVATLAFVVSVFMTFRGSQTTIQEAYDILVNLTILIYFIPYLYLFVAFIRLLRPGFAGTVAGVVGFLATLIALGFVFIPPAGTANVLNYEANILMQAFVIIAIGGVLFWRSRNAAQDHTA
jgi:glutamate:GABA antiporter